MDYQNFNSIPMYPEYAYDNADELDMDVEQIKEMQPQAVRRIQREVDEECDKLEYEGSCMFDECLSREYLDTIIDAIYERLMSDMEGMEVKAEQMNLPPWGPPPFRPPMGPGPQRPGRPDFRPDKNPDWMRHLISNVLFNEMLHRRRRFRRRRRSFRPF